MLFLGESNEEDEKVMLHVHCYVCPICGHRNSFSHHIVIQRWGKTYSLEDMGFDEDLLSCKCAECKSDILIRITAEIVEADCGER